MRRENEVREQEPSWQAFFARRTGKLKRRPPQDLARRNLQAIEIHCFDAKFLNWQHCSMLGCMLLRLLELLLQVFYDLVHMIDGFLRGICGF